MIVKAASMDFGYKIGILIAHERNGVRYAKQLKDGKFESVKAEPGVDDIEATYQFDSEEAQGIVDALYHLGIKPQGMKPIESELSAVRYHLEDIRTIALGKYKPVLFKKDGKPWDGK